jgi:hypothetical protein
MGPVFLDSKLGNWPSSTKSIDTCIVICTSIKLADGGKWAEAESLIDKVLRLLPGSIGTLPEPPFHPSPKIFNGVHFGVKIGQKMAHHPRLGFNELHHKKFSKSASKNEGKRTSSS